MRKIQFLYFVYLLIIIYRALFYIITGCILFPKVKFIYYIKVEFIFGYKLTCLLG